MAGNKKVEVDVVAQIEGFKAAMLQASNATKDFAANLQGHFSSLSAPIEAFNKSLIAIGSIAAGGYAFKSIIDATVGLTGETNKLSKSLGIGLDQASALRTELKTLGISTDDYIASALRLDRQIRTNSSTLERHGLVVRDANGKFLDQATIMRNAVDWLRQFKEGTDRNIAAQTIFGRNIGEVNAFLKMTAETAARAKKDVADLGLGVTVEGKENVKKYKEAVEELELTFAGIKKAIGEAVLPYLTRFAAWFREQGPTIISGMKEWTRIIVNGAVDIAISLVKMGEGWDNLKAKIMGAFHAGAAFTLGISGNLVAAAEQAKKAYEILGKDTNKDTSGAVTSLEAFRKRMLGGDPSSKPAADETPGRSAAGLIVDKQGNELKKLQAERDRLVNEEHIKAAMQQSQFDLDLGKKTNAQFLADKLAFQKQLDAIELDAANAKIAAAGNDVIAKQKAENDKLKIVQKSVADESALRHQAIMEQQKDILQLASSINSALTSGFANAFDNITKGLDGLKSALTGFLSSIRSALSRFAADSLVKSLFGSASGSGGLGGILAGFVGGRAGGGSIGAGQWAIAGENGPEAVFGGNSGATVYPNGAFGGGDTTIIQHIDARGSAGTSEIMAAIQRASQGTLEKAKAAMPDMMANWQQRYQ